MIRGTGGRAGGDNGGRTRSGGRRRWLRAAAAAAVLTAALAACSSANGATPDTPGGPTGGRTSQAPAPTIAFTPANGASAVVPDTPVTARATGGRITNATLTSSDGDTVTGNLSPDGATWTSSGPLATGATFTLTATAASTTGQQTTQKATFTVATPSHTVTAVYHPDNGTTVGVGMPISLTFNRTITDKAAVERNLSVTSTPAVTGAWSWINDPYESGSRIDFRPQNYWPAGTKVTLHMNLDGVNVGNGYYGTQNRTVTFTIGRAMVSTVDITAHTMTVTQDGKVLRVLPISAGGPDHATWNGTMAVVDLEDHVDMNSESVGLGNAYDVKDVRYAVRLTDSGTFVHAAPWNAALLGKENASHGCIGLSTSDAEWFWQQTIPGDVVTVIHSTSPPVNVGNGFTDWNESWTDWTAGSALH